MSNDLPVESRPDAFYQDTAQAEQLVVEARLSAGVQLTALREANGWTVEQVANQLNLAGRQIQALEADNYVALPGMVIVRGFIRSYAKLLKADPAPILAGIADQRPESPVLAAERVPLSASFSDSKLSSSSARFWSSKMLLALIAVAIIGAAFFVWQRTGMRGLASSGATASGEKLVLLEATELRSIAADAPSKLPKSIADAVKGAGNETVAAPVTGDSPDSALPARRQAAGQTSVATVTVSPADKDALAIRVRQDSWVEIKRADNSVVVSRLLKAGTAEAFDIKEPVTMVIGNAAGVDVTFRGAPIDVIASNASNVARLNLK